MELEKSMVVAAPIARVWDLLLDPKVMAGCVPGTQSVEIISDVEYVAEIKVKLSFIVARFKVKTKIVEAKPPHYLRIEGTGEDASVASSMKQTSELFLTEAGDGNTELRIKAKADVLGRLGSFGLSMMRTKADRMWDEFVANFAAIATRGGEPAAPGSTDGPLSDAVQADVAATQNGVDPVSPPQLLHPEKVGNALGSAFRPAKAKWWQKVVGSLPTEDEQPSVRRLATDIYIELHRPDGVIKVLWPTSAASDAARWLKDIR